MPSRTRSTGRAGPGPCGDKRAASAVSRTPSGPSTPAASTWRHRAPPGRSRGPRRDRSPRVVGLRRGGAAMRRHHGARRMRSGPGAARPERDVVRSPDRLRRRRADRVRRRDLPRPASQGGGEAALGSVDRFGRQQRSLLEERSSCSGPPRAWARPAHRSSSRAMSSSGSGPRRQRCHARRSGSVPPSITSAIAWCTRRRSSSGAERNTAERARGCLEPDTRPELDQPRRSQPM